MSVKSLSENSMMMLVLKYLHVIILSYFREKTNYSKTIFVDKPVEALYKILISRDLKGLFSKQFKKKKNP